MWQDYEPQVSPKDAVSAKGREGGIKRCGAERSVVRKSSIEDSSFARGGKLEVKTQKLLAGCEKRQIVAGRSEFLYVDAT